MSIIGLQQRRWRRLMSCVVAYAFALYVALAGFAAARALTLADVPGAAGAALCLHDAGDAPPAPADNSGDCDHCKFCPVAGHELLAAAPASQHFVAHQADRAPLLAADWLIPGPIAHATPQPRGPPRTA
ncbi:MAG TPA: hypothetical protein VEK73_00295 [Xanthobacteraceae bacterium]|nr:hypothetical protein [Xanthobacteraceae bacterium]